MHRKNFSYFITIVMLIGVISLGFIVNLSKDKTEIRGRAQSANVQVQCSPAGKVQFAISFTNPESVPINLLAQVLIDTQTISRNYLDVPPGQTRTDLISTNLTSLSNVGDVIFTWFPITNPTATNDIPASFNQITCDPVTPTLFPTSSVSAGEADSTILALTPLPPQPEITPAPFYQGIVTEVTMRVQTLITNVFRFFSVFQ